MKNKLLPVLLILFLSLSGNTFAQNTGEGQMDEKFNTKEMPYGWFTEGWVLNDSTSIQSQASAGLDLSSLLGSTADKYLLTPPLKVSENGKLVIKVKKTASSRGGGGSTSGDTDEASEEGDSEEGDGGEESGSSTPTLGGSNTLYVDRSVYGSNKWVQLGEFTDELTTDYQEMSFETSEAGEYRFRLRATKGIIVDSIAGGQIDMEAPDLLVTVDSIHVRTIDFGVLAKDSVKKVMVINTGTGTLKGTIALEEESIFSINNKNMEIAAGDTLAVDLNFDFEAARTGRNETNITFTPDDTRLEPQTISVTAIVPDAEAWLETFDDNKMPEGWFTDGWEVKDKTEKEAEPTQTETTGGEPTEGETATDEPKDGVVVVVASDSGSGIGSIMGGSTKTYFLETPPLKVADSSEALTFMVKSGSGGGIGALLGGGGATLVVERSVYGSNRWEKIKEIDNITTEFKTAWVSYAEPGEYRYRFIASDSLVIDSVAGHVLDTNAPDLNVTQNGSLVSRLDYGMPQGTATQTITLVNTGTGTLDVTIERSNELIFSTSIDSANIPAGDSVKVDITFVYNEKELGEHHETLFITPQNEGLAQQQIALSAYSIYTDAWKEDFEQEYVIDAPDKAELPAGWETTGWEVGLPEATLDLGSLLGGNSSDNGNQTYAVKSESDDYELITPTLQAKKGDVLGFDMEQPTATGDAISGIMGEETAEAPTLYVYYSRNGGEWKEYGEYGQTGKAFFTAPYSGIYRLMFKGKNIRLDNFMGFRLPMEEVTLTDAANNDEVLANNAGRNVNVNYDRTLAATQKADGTWIPRAFIVSLPYDYDFTEYYEADMARIYRLRFKEEYYKQFVFTRNNNKNPNLMLAGKAYLVVVMKGRMNLSAIDATMTDEAVDDESNVVNSFEDWYFEDKLTPVGKWLANLHSISDVEADTKNIYGMRNDGSWARFQSEGGVPKYQIAAFRGYLDADATDTTEPADPAAAPRHMAPPAGLRKLPPLEPGTYHSQFQDGDNQGTGMDDGRDYDGMEFEGTIPYIQQQTTGIQPTIRAIDADGTSHFYDLQGREINGTPDKGLFIYDGKKVVKRK